MKSMLYIGMAIMLFSFMGLAGIICIVGLLISVASDSRGMTSAAFKERLPTFLALSAFLAVVALLAYGVGLLMQYYGA
jgi:hypothetical protein